jgi:DNA-binding transcriptional ArsR family regulator
MHADIEGFTMPAPEAVDSAAETLRILSDPTRLRILWALSQGESSVACLAELSGANPTSVSQHLAKLRLAGVVWARRQGTYMF